jgi:glycosyltransferase involved in cell wall biosynthesis
VKILLWHGYLLSGSGSNVYTANLARSWRAQGHDVLLLCQHSDVAALPFIDGVLTFSADNSRLEGTSQRDASAGRCLLARPDIGGSLPVYVYDDYAGFTVKRFVDLTDDELDDYTARNIRAMTTAIEAHRPDAIVTGHEVMGPKIALEACRRSGSPYLAKLHGSGLEFAVKEQERYRRFASEGLDGAAVVVGGSEYMLREAASVIGDFDTTAVVNPGVDVDLFNPLSREPGDTLSVGFVGKLIALKGVHNLLAAVGLTRDRPMKLTVVGYGGFERGLHALAASLASGDLDEARSIAHRGEDGPLEHLVDFLSSDANDEYLRRARDVDVDFTGRLEHDPLAKFLPTLDVLVVPSVVPEAFGMVAAEAAACGVLPIVPNHSGIAEAGRAVEDAIGEPGLLTFDAEDPVRGIAAAIDRVLDLPFEERQRMGWKAVELARERWAWGRVADRLLALATDGSGALGANLGR